MGKNKAQRTKNNAKPSSSGRSAELLGTAIPNFVGFSAVKNGGYVPVLPGLSISSSNEFEVNTLDSNYQLVLKKMNKKDATTKYKALQEFANLCNSLPLPAVEAVIPFWPKLYHILADDVEHRVREAAQLAHAALVKRVGRNIAQYLKKLAGPWFTSQFDTYPPAASAASNSFQETFPQKKTIDAIVHCQEEILSHIFNNIILETPQSMNNNKTIHLTPEELETKYQRLLICNLHAYCYYFTKVSNQHIEKTMNIHQQIISNAKFWKLARHESALIKSVFFNVLASIIHNAKNLLDNEKKRTITAIMNSLDDTEPGVISAVWECMLVAIDGIDGWYTVVSMEKLALPKLWRALRSGGQRCASIIYPGLLPLISQFPKFNLDIKQNLFIQFFENMRCGFEIKNVQMSRTEMSAITKSFIECLRYTILVNNDNIELCETLLQDQLMPVIETSIKDYSPIKIILFNELANLLHYWSKNRDGNYKSYSSLITKFWSELEIIFQRLIDDLNNQFDNSVIANIYDAQFQLLFSLSGENDGPRKNGHVTFADTIDLNEQKQTQMQQTHKIQNVSIEEDEIFSDELDKFASKLCIAYLKNRGQIPSTNTILHLNRFVSHFGSKMLFLSIAKAYKDDENLLGFYNSTLKNWLLEKNIDTITTIQFIFIFMKHMSDDEKKSVLQSLKEFDDKRLLNSVIAHILSEKNNSDPLIKGWCEDNHITEHLKEVAKKLINNEHDDSDEHLLLMAFESFDGDISVNEDAINNVLIILCESLKKSDVPSSEYIAQLVSRLLKFMWNYKKWTRGSLEILKILFELNVQNKLSVAVKESVRANLTYGFPMICKKLSEDQVFEIQMHCLNVIYENIHELNQMSCEEMVDIAADFIEASNNYNYNDALKMIVEFNCAAKNIFELWIPQLTNIVLHAEIVSGNFHLSNPIKCVPLNCPPTFIVSEKEQLPHRVKHCLHWSLFNAQLLNRVILKLDDFNINLENNSNVSDCLSNLPHILNGILLITSLIKLYCKHYKSTYDYDMINNQLQLLVVECAKLRQDVPKCIFLEKKFIWKKILLDSSDIENYWTEFGSIFAEFLGYYYGDNAHLSEVQVEGREILNKYLHIEKTSLTSVDHINAVVLARNLLDNIENYELCSQIFAKMTVLQDDCPFLLFSQDIGNVEWSNFCLPLEVIRLCTKLVTIAATKMCSVMWNNIMTYLLSWQISLIKSKHNHDDLKVQCLIAAVSQLFCAVQSLMNEHKKKFINELPPRLLDKWQGELSIDANRQITNVWMYYANLYNEKNDYLTPILILQYLGDAIKVLDGDTFFESSSCFYTVSSSSDELMQFSFKLILSSIPTLQLAAYYSLSHLIRRLVEEDKTTIEQEDFDNKLLNICKFENILLSTQKIVNKMLMDFKLCDNISCIVQPFTDSYTYTFGYLLAWSNVLDMCSYAHADLRYQYGEILKVDLFPCLMNNIFRLLPGEILQDNNTRVVSAHSMELFRKPPTLNFGDSLTEWKLEQIVCWVYGNCLRHLPVLVRQWWSTTESRVSNAVERITTVYVSPILCQEELTNKKLNDVANLQIKVHSSVREVIATYEMDDTKLELYMILPVNYPLGPVVVEPGQHAGSVAVRRNCHMQLSIFLTHQNGSIWDALVMWKKNLDKKFAGVEECYICFSIFHINTSQIPKLSCHTCRKKFHAPCLYKWFSTTQKSTCPICRTIF